MELRDERSNPLDLRGRIRQVGQDRSIPVYELGDSLISYLREGLELGGRLDSTSLQVGVVVLKEVLEFSPANVSARVKPVLGNVLHLGVLRLSREAADGVSNTVRVQGTVAQQSEVSLVVIEEVPEGCYIAAVVLGVLQHRGTPQGGQRKRSGRGSGNSSSEVDNRGYQGDVNKGRHGKGALQALEFGSLMLDRGLAAGNSDLFVEAVLFVSELLFVYSQGKAGHYARGVVRGGIALGRLGDIRGARGYNRGHGRRSAGSGSYLPAPNGSAPGREEFNISGPTGPRARGSYS